MPHHSYWGEIFPNTGNLTSPPLVDVLQQSRDAGCGPMLGQGQMQTPLPMRSDMETESSFNKFCSCLNQLWGSIWWHWKSLPTFWMLMFKRGFAGFRSYCKQLFHRWTNGVAALLTSPSEICPYCLLIHLLIEPLPFSLLVALQLLLMIRKTAVSGRRV